MKKIIIFLFLVFSSSIFCQISNLKYVTCENIWNVGPIFNEKPSRYTFSCDSTLINEKYYFRKLYSSTEQGEFDLSGTYYREENGVVYEFDFFNNKEKVVFNFQLNVGDSITVNDPDQEMKLTVIKIDSVIYDDNIYRRRTTLKCENNDEYEWVEGFGTTYLIYPYCYLDNNVGTITCLYVNGNLVFENDFGLPCWYLGVGTEEIKSTKISMYPNPTYDKLFILSEAIISDIKIFSMDGKLMGVYKANEIPLTDYTTGMYLIQVEDNNKNKSIGKLFKI